MGASINRQYPSRRGPLVAVFLTLGIRSTAGADKTRSQQKSSLSCSERGDVLVVLGRGERGGEGADRRGCVLVLGGGPHEHSHRRRFW